MLKIIRIRREAHYQSGNHGFLSLTDAKKRPIIVTSTNRATAISDAVLKKMKYGRSKRCPEAKSQTNFTLRSESFVPLIIRTR